MFLTCFIQLRYFLIRQNQFPSNLFGIYLAFLKMKKLQNPLHIVPLVELNILPSCLGSFYLCTEHSGKVKREKSK